MGKVQKGRGGFEEFNKVSKSANIIFNCIFLVLALACVVPLIFIFIISISTNESIAQLGYSFFPNELSKSAYEYLWDIKDTMGRAFIVSVFLTIGGTGLGLLLNASMGYVLSRRNYRLKKFFTYLIFIPMVFNGGMVSSYMINTQLLMLKNSIWALLLPIAVSSFYIIILRTFFQTTIPDSIIESAKMDGANQLVIFFKLVLPISLPALAAIGLFLAFGYWNDWFLAMLYMDDQGFFPLQYVLMRIERNVEFLATNGALMGNASDIANRLPRETIRMAIVMVVVVPIAVTYPFFQKYFISGLTIGAVKG